MEIGQYPVSSCSKEHQKIYQEWFALADSGPIHPLLCSPPIPNPPLLLLLAWVVVCSNRRCCRWGWPHHGPRRHQVLRHVQALPPRPQAGAAYRCDPSRLPVLSAPLAELSVFLFLMCHFCRTVLRLRYGRSRTPDGRGTWVSPNLSRQCRFAYSIRCSCAPCFYRAIWVIVHQ